MNPPTPLSFNFPPLPPDFDDPPIPTWLPPPPPPPPPPPSNGGWIIALLIIVFAASLFACALKGYRIKRARAEAEAAVAAAARLQEWYRSPPLPRLQSHRLPRARTTNPAARLPSFRYNRSVRHNVTGGGEEAATCSVCLAVFQLGETVRLLPACLHLYHAECIDPWLDSHSTCPICRADADPTMDGARLPRV